MYHDEPCQDRVQQGTSVSNSGSAMSNYLEWQSPLYRCQCWRKKTLPHQNGLKLSFPLLSLGRIVPITESIISDDHQSSSVHWRIMTSLNFIIVTDWLVENGSLSWVGLGRICQGICALQSPKLQVEVQTQDRGPCRWLARHWIEVLHSEVGDIGVGAVPSCITAATRSYN